MLCGAVVALIVHVTTIERAAAVRTDLRYQLSAYLDVVTMLLAGNSGYEGALEQASHAGDGRLFAEVRRRMRESAARGASLTDALHQTGVDLGLEELEQVAATAALERRRRRAGRPHPRRQVRHAAHGAGHRAGVRGAPPDQPADHADRRHGLDLHGPRDLPSAQLLLSTHQHTGRKHRMSRITLLTTAVTHQLYGAARAATGRLQTDMTRRARRRT